MRGVAFLKVWGEKRAFIIRFFCVYLLIFWVFSLRHSLFARMYDFLEALSALRLAAQVTPVGRARALTTASGLGAGGPFLSSNTFFVGPNSTSIEKMTSNKDIYTSNTQDVRPRGRCLASAATALNRLAALLGLRLLRTRQGSRKPPCGIRGPQGSYRGPPQGPQLGPPLAPPPPAPQMLFPFGMGIMAAGGPPPREGPPSLPPRASPVRETRERSQVLRR